MPLQKEECAATDPEWRAKGWLLKCFLALSFTLTLILLQCNSLYFLFPVSLCSSLSSPHSSSAIQPLPLFYFAIYYPPHPLTPLWLFSVLSSVSSPTPSPRLPALLLLSYLSVRAELKDCAMQETGSQIHPCSSSYRKMSHHFLRARKLFLPLSYHTAAAVVWHCMQTAVRWTARKMDRHREGDR